MKMSIDMLNDAQLSHVLGLDFGKAKVGIAIADSETKMAFALDIFKNDNQLFDKLKEVIADKNVQIVVLGMTKHEKDELSVQEKRDFAQKLRDELDLEVYLQEEMFTTKMAQENIKMQGRKNIAAADDKEAARIILQSWLDLQ